MSPEDPPDIALLRHLVDFGLALVVWVVQAIVYPSFRWSEAGTFPAWHATYTRAISWFVVPLMLGQAALAAAALVTSPTALSIVTMILVAAGFAITFGLAVPEHRRLASGKNLGAIERLLRANRLRAIVWSVVFGLGFL